MSDPSRTLSDARQLGRDQQLAYAGAMTPQQAHALLQDDPKVILIDVRTRAERDWIGQPALPATQQHLVQWNLYPQSQPNPHFLEELRAAAPDRDSVLLFLCRSGVRSKAAAAAATADGYAQCFDILQGFEGNKDAQGHRKSIEGWCHAGLPWVGA